MKNRSYTFLFAFAALILLVGLACGVLSVSTPSQPQQPVVTSAPVSNSNSNSSNDNGSNTSSSSDLVTFTDQNEFYQIDLPGDWKYTSGTETDLYWDRFAAPDENAFIENIVYDDGTPWTGSQKGKAALKLLNTYYSYTKREGDIRISDDSIQKDGSERLTWTSKGGGYSGISYFEVRSNQTTFLMFTVWWNDSFEDQYIDILNNVISSYRIP